jgi:hypothetical protein
MSLPPIYAGSAICCGYAVSSTLSTPGSPNRRRTRRASMQLDLDLFDPPDTPPKPPATWELIDEAARLSAIEILARVISRMLQGAQEKEADDE